MQIDGLEWTNWLHKKREESERERKRRGISGAEWLKGIRVRADAYMEERAGQATIARPQAISREP
ncbi:MAG: hypothetical protein NTX53_19990 [candidate division WOR-3 bacterium]|nr:hypothetical protein [candidate division WOR-3 bacterium]